MYPINAAPVISGPVSTADIERIEAAKLRSRSIRRAVWVAYFNGWSLGIFAALSLPFALFGDIAALVCGVVLAIFTFNEFRGGSRLKRFDRAATNLLGWNQIALGLAMIIYAVWSMMQPGSVEAPAPASGDAHIDETIQNLTSILTLLIGAAKYVVYGALAVIGLVVPGLNALYYFSRAKHIDKVVATTEPWVIQTLRAAA